MKKKREFEIPAGFKYTKLDEWIEIGGNNILTLGITDFAQYQMGDINSVLDFPEIGTMLEPLLEQEHELTIKRGGKKSTAKIPGKTIAVIDCSKGEFFVYSPVKGKIVEINAALSDFGAGEVVNKDPYQKGWLVKIEITDTALLNNLLDAEGYKKFIRGE